MSTLNVGTVNAGAGVQLPSYATANLPTGGISAGFLAFDSTVGTVKVWNGTKWQRIDESVVNAQGGNEVYTFGNFKIHKFTSSGSFSVQSTQNDAKMDFMIVGGGGGGGCSDGNCSNGGGGAGGLVYKSNVAVVKGDYPVVIGSGGSGYYNQDTKGDTGGDSSFFGYTALGGGGGGAGGNNDRGNARPGGSGGGGSHPYSGSRQAGLQPSSASGGFGNAGGNCTPSSPEWGGGGGGGAGEQGEDGSAPRGGYGGDGLLYNIDGMNKYYAGGGAGANCNNPNNSVQPGGLGGGGWAAGTIVGGQGGNGFGGGGGGAGYPNRTAGNGGNGVVIIRYAATNIDSTIGQSSGNPAESAGQILAANPSASDGTYWIKPVGYSGGAQQIYCWMSAGGWMLVASNWAGSGTIAGGTSRRSSSYFLNRSGALGTPSPNNDYIIGSMIDSLNFSAVRVLGFGWNSTNNSTSWNSALSNLGTWVQAEWTLSQSGVQRLTEITPRVSVAITSSGGGLSPNAGYFVLDGIKADSDNGGFNANVNQTTVGGVGVAGNSGDPSTGCYLGHGTSEGNYEGWYNSSNSSANSQGYTTWVR